MKPTATEVVRSYVASASTFVDRTEVDCFAKDQLEFEKISYDEFVELLEAIQQIFGEHTFARVNENGEVEHND